MKKDLTHLTLVIDTSGSMASIKNDAIGGVNSLLEKQKNEIGNCTVSIIEFNNKTKDVITNKDIKSVPVYNMNPGGGTAMLDGIGYAINSTGSYLTSLKEEDRPSLVVVAIITDGEENSSREFNYEKIKEMVEHQKSVYNWQFTFLCTDQSVLDKANNLGLDGLVYSVDKSQNIYKSISGNISRMRSQTINGDQVMSFYSQEEKESVV